MHVYSGFWILNQKKCGVLQHVKWSVLIFVRLMYLYFENTSNILIQWTSEVAQSCPTLCDPVDCSPTGSSVHGILQARILEWVEISFSRGSSWARDRTRVSHTVGRCFTFRATREALVISLAHVYCAHAVWGVFLTFRQECCLGWCHLLGLQFFPLYRRLVL